MRKRPCLNSCLLHELVHSLAPPTATPKWNQISLKTPVKLFTFLYLIVCSHYAISNESKQCINENSTATRYQAPPVFDTDKIEHTNISADITRTDSEGMSLFEGHVVIERHELRITAEKASYDQDSESLEVSGGVHVDTVTMSLDARHGAISTESRATEFSDTQFLIQNTGMRGHAETIIAGDNINTNLKKASITSCDPSDPDWRLTADTIELDLEDEYGTADDVVVRFMEVPFLYVPYMEFPIGDRRRSGLLVPDIGYSDSRGGEFSVPWYWNIAPNQDAILAPRFMSRRGTQLDTEYRFLTSTTRGDVNLSFLPDDNITDENRHQFQYQQHTDFTRQLKLDMDIQDVSDINYFDDFSNNLSTSSATHLNRSLTMSHNSQYWQARGLAQTFETLDPNIATANRPYRRLPQITLYGDQPLGNSGLAFTLGSEWVDFDHEESSVTTGSRLTVKPGFYWLSSGASWFVKPAVNYSFTQYDTVDGSGADQDLDDRKLSTSSLDAGLFFEREFNSDLIQTLEPRMYYLNVPYRNQDVLPNFDTGLSTFSITQLFRDNRFNGGDRVGDANQLTMVVSSRILNTYTGDEYLRASIGQIFYFDDRKVSLDGSIDDSRDSDLIGELGASWNNWSFTSSVQWGTESHRSERENFLLHYQSDIEHIFNIGLRTDRTTSTEIRQTDISFVAPLFDNFSTFARWNYSLKDDRDIEVTGGFSYDSCCWSIQLLGQRQLQDTTISSKEYDNSFMVQLVFKGLGSVSGNDVSDTLKQSILGYDEDY